MSAKQEPRRKMKNKKLKTKLVNKDVKKEVRKEVKDMKMPRQRRKMPRIRNLNLVEEKFDAPGKVGRANLKKKLRGTVSSTELALRKCAEVVMLPLSTPAIRWSSQFSEKATALAVPWQRQNALWLPPGTAGKQMPNTDTFAIIFRNPERFAIIYDSNPAGLASIYVFSILGTLVQLPSVTPTIQLAPNNAVGIHLCYAVPTTLYQPHGPLLLCGTPSGDSEEQERFVWFDLGTTLTFQSSASIGGVNVTFFMNRYSKGGERDAVVQLLWASTTGYSAIQTLTPPSSGYYSFSVSSPTVITLGLQNVQYNLPAGNDCFRHLTLNQFFSNITSVQGLRINGASLMYSNTAAETARQGVIAGLQLTVKSWWPDYINNFGTLSSSEDATQMRADNGLYGFLKPNDIKDFLTQKHSTTTGSNIVDSFYPLELDTPALIIYAQIPPAANTTIPNPQVGYWTFGASIEYATLDVWRATNISRVPVETWNGALELVKKVPAFHENPLHLQEIWDSIVSKAQEYLPSLFNLGLNAVARLLGG